MEIKVPAPFIQKATSLLTEITDPCAEAILYLIKSHLLKSLDFGLSLGSLTCDLILSSDNFEYDTGDSF